MTRKPNCIHPLDQVENPITSLPYVAPSVETILADPRKILWEISANIQLFVNTIGNIHRDISSSQYEKVVLPRQLESWHTLSAKWKEKMMRFWPNWLHKSIKLSKWENHILHAIFYALKNHKNGYSILNNLITLTGTHSYWVLFWADIFSLRWYSIPIWEFHDWDRENITTTQLWDRVMVHSYEKIGDNTSIQVASSKLWIDERGWIISTNPEIILTNILGKKFETKTDMMDWKEGEDIWIFEYMHISSKNYSPSFDKAIPKHVFIIKWFNPKSGIIKFLDPHSTKKIHTIDLETFLNLPGLQIVYGNPES